MAASTREQMYFVGLYARPTPVAPVTTLAVSVVEYVSVYDRGYLVQPESALVPVLIPSYRRRRMV